MIQDMSKAVGGLRDDMIDLLSRLVQLPSVRGGELPSQLLLEKTLGKMGGIVDAFTVDKDALASLPGFSPVEWDYLSRPNVVARFPGKGGGRSIILNGHVDVVPTGPLDQWSVDPWGGEVMDGRLYGRGAGDMKAGLVQIIWALNSIARLGLELKGDVLVESVIEEECTGNGTLACRARGYMADAALITEPTDLNGETSTMGVMWARITVEGKSQHAADMVSSSNAIECMAPVIRSIRDLQDSKNREIPLAYAEVPSPIRCIPGIIRGGDWPSMVAPRCSLECRIGSFPEQSLEDTKAQLEECVREASLSDGWLRENPPTVSYFGFQAEGSYFDTGSDLAKVLGKAHSSIVGKKLEFFPSTATDDSRFFNLYCAIPCTCYGPSAGNIHGADEWVDLRSLETASEVLAGFLLDWCGV